MQKFQLNVKIRRKTRLSSKTSPHHKYFFTCIPPWLPSAASDPPFPASSSVPEIWSKEKEK